MADFKRPAATATLLSGGPFAFWGQVGHSAAEWRELIASTTTNLFSALDPRWIEAQIHVESGGDPLARSTHGAMGLMQLMPGAAFETHVHDPFDPPDNVRGGVTYLLRQYEALREIPVHEERLFWAFAAYNCGRGYIDFGGGFTCLELARIDEPKNWWRWDVGRYWLMHRDLSVRGLHPDHRQVWQYVARIRSYFEGGQ